MTLTAVALTLALALAAAVALAEPITPCETKEARLADKGSCTRFHICREVSHGEFTTDIAICPDNMLFDMVTSTCIDQREGYVQDPTSCTTFYGCHPPEQRGEGLTRRFYHCTGDLRFHPDRKLCTYKTNVPDSLCNNRMPSQHILGEDKSQTTTTTTTTTTTPTTTTTTTTAPATTTTGSNSQHQVVNSTRSTILRPATGLTDLERITQVIKGQLLTRNKVNLNSRDAAAPPASRD